MVKENAKETLKLGELVKAIDVFASIDKDMPMMMLRTLLLLMQEDGRGPNEIAKKLGVAPGVTSRHISDLGDHARVGKGHGLLEQKMDPGGDRRYRVAYLTHTGKGKRAEVLRALGVY